MSVAPPAANAANEPDDLTLFTNQCVFMYGVYRHFHELFELASETTRSLIHHTAPIFFGDLHQVFVEYIVLQVCKITDPAEDGKNKNHTLEFLLKRYDVGSDPNTGKPVGELASRIGDFRRKILPARNKLISHADRTAVHEGEPLGATLQSEWDQFWADLRDLLKIMHSKALRPDFDLMSVGMITDVDSLVKALTHASHFDRLLTDKDQKVARRAAEIAFGA